MHWVHLFWGHRLRQRFSICKCDTTFNETLVNIFPSWFKSKDHLLLTLTKSFLCLNLMRRLVSSQHHSATEKKFQHIKHNVYIKKRLLHTPTCILWVRVENNGEEDESKWPRHKSGTTVALQGATWFTRDRDKLRVAEEEITKTGAS